MKTTNNTKIQMFNNTNRNIFATFANSTINNNPHLIASTYSELDIYEFDFDSIQDRLSKLNINKVIFFHISNSNIGLLRREYGNTNTTLIQVLSLSYSDFFNKDFLLNKLFTYKGKFSAPNHILFCFSDRSWLEILYSFKLKE